MDMDMQGPKNHGDRGEAAAESPLHGDVLELILSHVPLVDLVPAHRVSRSWNLAVSSSLQYYNRPRPWLVVHSQSLRPPYATETCAFDPRSLVWVELRPQDPSANCTPSGLCLQSGRLLYSLSPSQFSFSVDPLGLSWNHADPPLVWRPDPIVSAVGRHIVVAGGGCDFDDDPLAVEIYDLETRKWEAYDAMPSALRDCSTSTCLSVASCRGRVFVAEKLSGAAYSFDPKAKEWHGPYDLRPDQNIYCSVIGFAGDRLLLIGLIDDGNSSQRAKTVKIWEVLGEAAEFWEVAEMPLEFLKELRGDDLSISSISVCSAGDMVYLYDPSKPEAVVWCEAVTEGRGCEWGIIRKVPAPAPADGQSRSARRAVFGCWDVGIAELEKARASEKVRFFVAKKSKQGSSLDSDCKLD